MRLVDLALTLVTLAVGATMVLTYFVPYVDPGSVWFFPVLGLAAPAVYVASVVLTLYWIIRWRWVCAGAMLVVVVAGLFKVSLFWRPEIRRSYATETAFDRAAVKVMSYNVRSFYGEDGRSSVDDILRLIEEQAPDLICLQEFNARLAEQSEEFSLLGEKYEIAHFGRTQAPDSVYGSTLTILSKYRILRSDTVLTPSSSVWADVIVGEDTVRVFNNHLRSTAINASDNQFITSHQFLSDTARETKIRSIVTRLRENSVLRAAQVDSIAQVVGATRTRRIVCGDFNVAPLENDVWNHRQMLKIVSHTPVEIERLTRLKNSLNFVDVLRKFHPEPEKAYSWWSYRNPNWQTNNKGRRLDHIWTTPNLEDRLVAVKILKEARNWERPSDHVPVIAEIKR